MNGSAMLSAYVPSALDEALRVAEVLARSGAVGRMSPGEVFAVSMAGARFGLDPITACRTFFVADGRVGLYASGMHGLVLASGLVAELALVDDPATNGCERATWLCRRQGSDAAVRVSFTREAAEAAGLWGRRSTSGKPSPWVLYPDRMLTARALAKAVRQVWPDVVAGLYTMDEMRGGGPLPEDVIDAETVAGTPPPAALAAPADTGRRRVEPSPAVAGLLPGGAGILVDEAQEFTRVVAEPARRRGLSPGVVDALSGLRLFMPSPDASPETVAREAARYIDERRDEFLAWRAEARAVDTMTEAEAERRLLGCPQVPLGGDAAVMAGIPWENACAVIEAASGGTASLRGDGPGVGRRRALWVLAAEGGPRAHACRAFLAAFPGDAAAELAVVCSDDALALALESGPSRKLYEAVAQAVRPKGVDRVEGVQR